MDGVGTVFVPEDTKLIGPWLVTSPSLQPLINTILRDGWLQRNYRRKAVPLMRTRGFATDLDIADKTSMRHEPFYTELMADHGLGCFVGLQFTIGSQVWFAAIERAADAPLPDAMTLERAGRVRLMLSAAARASETLGARRFAGWRDVVAEPARAVVALDRLGRVVDVNAAAERLLGHGLLSAKRSLHLSDPVADVGFQALVAAARASPAGAALPAPVTWRAPDGRYLMADVIPASPRLIDFHQLLSALVVIRVIERGMPSLPDALRRFGLSPAEARLAIALYEGRSVIEYAEIAGNSAGTVRNQLKSIFRKTGVRRQAELVVWMSKIGM